MRTGGKGRNRFSHVADVNFNVRNFANFVEYIYSYSYLYSYFYFSHSLVGKENKYANPAAQANPEKATQLRSGTASLRIEEH